MVKLGLICLNEKLKTASGDVVSFRRLNNKINIAQCTYGS